MLNLTTNGPNTLVAGIPSSTEIVAPYNPSYTYTWSGPILISPTSSPAVITHNWQGVNLNTSYTYNLIITEITTGCTNDESITIYEKDIPPPCTGPECCIPEAYSLTPSASLSGGYCATWGFSYTSSNVSNVISWNFGDLSGSSSSLTPTYTYTEIGYYNVIISGQVPNTAGPGFCTVSESVAVNVAMIAQFGTEVSCVPNPTNAPQLCLTDETAYLPGTSLSSINFTVSGSGSSSVSPACFGSLNPGSAYTANLTATHSSGCIDDFTQAVTIPGPVIISATPPVLCLEQTADFTATCAGAVSFDWNFDDSSVGGAPDALFDGDSPQHSYAQNSNTDLLGGPYTPIVSVVATHANGCQFTDNISIVVNDLPPTETITSLDGDFKFCYGGSETLEVISAFDVFWWMVNNSGPGCISSSDCFMGVVNSLTVTSEGEYYATIFDNNTGCETVLDPVLVQQWPLVPAFITGPSILCEGDCTELLAPTGNYLYQWYNSNGSPLGSTNSIEVCSNEINGNDTFKLTVIDPISLCENTYSLVITVEQNPVVQIDTSPDPPCEGAEVTLFVNPTLLAPDDYVWTGGQTGYQFTTFSEGIYTVVAIDPLTGCKGYATETVHPCPNLCEVATGCYTACDTGKTVCGPLGLSTYLWTYFPANGPSSNAGNTRCITMTQEGDYSLTATNIYGCPKTSGLLEMEFISCDSCQFAYADMLDLQLQSLGTSLYSTDIDGDGINEDVSCCVWSVNPIISTANGANPSTLCMDIIWGDGDVQYNVPLGSPVEHCYTEECHDYQIIVKIRCCDGTNSHSFTATAFCDCIPNCYIKNSFWESITEIVGADSCHIEFTGNQFLGPDMDSYQNPEYSIIGVDNNGNSVGPIYGYGVNFSYDLNPGTYQVCYTIEGLSSTGDLCTSEHCHEVVVDCCGSTIDPCLLPENIVFFPEVGTFGTSCEDGCEWHFCLGVNSDFDDSHCFTWDFDDGTSYSSNTAECAIHCFAQSGTYNVCLTVYCCDDPTLYIQYCETIVVNCGAPCELSAGAIDAEQMFLSADSCCFGVCPVLTPWSDVDPMSLCIDIDWGDDSAPLLGQMFAMCYDHCYGADGTYTITVTVYCCDDPASVFVFTETVSCGGCVLPADLVFYPSGSNQSGGAICPDGKCEWNFCLGIDFDFSSLNDSHCFTWDYGDGTIQTSNTPQCGVHCYTSGIYNVCFTVYCCDDPTQYVEYCETIVVNCDGGGGGGCEYDQTMVDFEWGTNSTCTNGCDEVWFCASDFVMDPNTCISWDFGDGNSYSPALPECPIHCYNSPGVYTACLTVYCCEEGPLGPSAYTICHEVVVSCGTGGGCLADCPDFNAGLGLISLGTSTDASGASCCEYGLSPTLLSDSCLIDNLFDLCINVDWGDGSPPLQNAPFPQGYLHCFPTGGTYTVTMVVYCCTDGADSQSWTFTDTVTCTGGGCDLPQIDFEWGRNSACANTGCDEIWFCATNFIGDDPNVCLSWDFGDGNIYNPPLPECPIHCYNSAGVYNACLTVYCCEEGPFGPSAYEVCHEVIVSCGCLADCPDFNASLGLISLGTSTDASGASCCEYGLSPTLLSDSCLIDNLFDLCINVDWGDGSPPLQNAPFPQGYLHCFPTGGTYTVTMDVYCCADGAESQTWTFTETVICTGSVCEIPANIDFEWGTNSNCANTGCDQIWFCATNFLGDDPNVCLSWDFGDGNSYSPALPECPIHCYDAPGIYNACLTVYCCEEGLSGPSAYTICHEVIVSCGTGGGCLADCPDFEAGLGLISLGTSTDASGATCCEFGLVPELIVGCGVDFWDLCINVDWGDGSPPLQNASFPHGYLHCFPSGGTYTVTMDVYCCADGNETTQVWTFTDTVTCTGGGVCDFDQTMIDFEWGTNSNCLNGCDEVWFCANDLGIDPNLCMSWDFGDGNVYNPGLPECPIHCYNSAGTYNACLTVYCCEEILSPAYTICHTVNVSCGVVESYCTGDYDLDGFIGVVDLLELLGAYGAACQ